ncbi:MAG TPA: UDP-glucose/GDP-mannose dehydrogenase family protein [bacterium]|nr:UDP-glucose/GDP-mannose dehydrogenase family protein [bacterium]HOL34556.1 UDP-glucose/GDP-mannose dehydrogenase family protein [bacterium]HPP07542.1 UDP-glucose/GDP-mannose dehydrogenase family protein [bacterium]
MKHIGVIGAGHVGLVTAACFAKMGNFVICADNDIVKIKTLRENQMPFYEPQLENIVKDTVKKGRLVFTSSVNKLVKNSEIIFIAVGTPSTDSGEADLSAIENVIFQIAKVLNSKKQKRTYKLIVEKSTVPVFTGQWVKKSLSILTPTGIEFDVAANPEFLREGAAVNDFMKPDRIVVGVESERAKRILHELYKPLKSPIIFTDIKSAELIKHASNSFLATKISFINAISQICEKCGADIDKVAEGMGYDRRIGMAFLKAGIGYGGSCFPKDIKAFIRLAKRFGISFNLLKEVEKINKQQRVIVIEKALNFLNGSLKNKKICALGASFKPFTDDLRESPAVEVMKMLISKGAKVICYDPVALKNLSRTLPGVLVAQNPYDALKDAELMILLTEWPQFQSLDFKKVKQLMKKPRIIDGRNFLNPQYLKKLGFQYTGIGRKI